MDGRLVVKKISRDGSEAIRVVDDVRQSVTADLTVEGAVSYEISGLSRQNEDGVLGVCKILAERLRVDGLPTGEPLQVSGDERGSIARSPVAARPCTCK